MTPLIPQDRKQYCSEYTLSGCHESCSRLKCRIRNWVAMTVWDGKGSKLPALWWCLDIQTLSPWWRHQMETFSALLAICAGNSPVPGEFPTQRPVTRSFDVYFDLRPNKRLCKQSWGRWFETLSPPLWRHRNALLALCEKDIGVTCVFHLQRASGADFWRFLCCLLAVGHIFGELSYIDAHITPLKYYVNITLICGHRLTCKLS